MGQRDDIEDVSLYREPISHFCSKKEQRASSKIQCVKIL